MGRSLWCSQTRSLSTTRTHIQTRSLSTTRTHKLVRSQPHAHTYHTHTGSIARRVISGQVVLGAAICAGTVCRKLAPNRWGRLFDADAPRRGQDPQAWNMGYSRPREIRSKRLICRTHSLIFMALIFIFPQNSEKFSKAWSNILIRTLSGVMSALRTKCTELDTFQALAPLYYHGAHVALIVFDITDEQSYNKAKFWVYIYLCMYMHIYISIYIYRYIHVYIYTYIHTYIHTCIYMLCIHTHIHTHW